MMKQAIIALGLMLSLSSFSILQAQDVDPDFARRIRPEYKINLNPETVVLPTAHQKRTPSEIQADLANLKAQKARIEAELARLDAANTPKQDNMYVKHQLSLKSINGQIAEREKMLALQPSKQH